MYKTLPVLFAAGAVAQSAITTTWLGLDFDNTPVASVISVDSKGAVTYRISCSPEDIEADECGIPYDGMTVTMGPSVYALDYTDTYAYTDSTYSYAADFSMSESCSIQGTTRAVCVQSAGGSEANFLGVSTDTFTGDELTWSPLVITAGFDKLSATAGASASTTHASATGSSSSAAATGSAAQSGLRTSSGASKTASSTGAASASASASASGSAAAASSTGGAAQFAVPVAGIVGVLAAALAL